MVQDRVPAGTPRRAHFRSVLAEEPAATFSTRMETTPQSKNNLNAREEKGIAKVSIVGGAYQYQGLDDADLKYFSFFTQLFFASKYSSLSRLESPWVCGVGLGAGAAFLSVLLLLS